MRESSNLELEELPVSNVRKIHFLLNNCFKKNMKIVLPGTNHDDAWNIATWKRFSLSYNSIILKSALFTIFLSKSEKITYWMLLEAVVLAKEQCWISLTLRNLQAFNHIIRSKLDFTISLLLLLRPHALLPTTLVRWKQSPYSRVRYTLGWRVPFIPCVV